MNFCENCGHLTAESMRCPNCAKKRKLRAPRADDFCFLTEKGVIWAEMLMDVLKKNGIVYTYRARMGTGLSTYVGPALDQYQVFVPYAQYEAASDIVTELFSQAEQME